MQGARLEGLPLFSNLSPEEQAEIEALLEPASFGAGEEIFEEGGPEKCLYVLTSGTVKVYKEIYPSQRQHLATIHAPTVVGELGLMTEPKASTSVVTEEPVEALRLSHEEFLEKLKSGSSTAHKVVYEIGRTLAERMAKTDESITKIVARLEDARSDRDFDVFQNKLIQEWSF
jgi:CRP/FNR family cyclic AMP-dependent transcriptional regulator